jgi:hypothetical protein
MRFQEIRVLIKRRAPYRVPFYPNMVGVHLLISRPVAGVLEHFFHEPHEMICSNPLNGFPSRILGSAIFPPGWTCFFKGMARRASQWVAMQTPVMPCSFKALILLVKAVTSGSSIGVGYSSQVPWHAGSRPTKEGRLGSWFSQEKQVLCHPWREDFIERSRKPFRG